MPTLVMMHGMTGNSEMMRPFAEKILPEGWNLLVPQAVFSHPNRGYTWWRYEGGAMAQELLQFDLKVKGIIAIGTRVERPLELRSRLTEIGKNNLFWMHGESDHRVSLEAGLEIPELFEEAGWNVQRIQHHKGHMIPIEYHDNLKNWLQNL